MFKLKKNKRIFLDHASSTPLENRVFKEMKPFLQESFANPSAIYKEGVFVHKAVSKAREDIANLISAQKDEIVFTSNGTESINLALKGIFDYAKTKIKNPHIIVSALEHPSVLNTAKYIEESGGSVTYLPIDEHGFVKASDLREALKEETVLVSIMYANNEIGTIQPISEFVKEIRYAQKNKIKNSLGFPFFHTDASQAAGYLEINTVKLGVDLMTLDAGKIYGPKGIGLLFVKRKIPLVPQILGGGQEGGRRSGTENVASIVGFAKALSLAESMRAKEVKRLSKLRDFAWESMKSNFPDARLNGSSEKRLPNNLNVCFPKTDNEFMVLQLDVRGFACSSSSSCRTISENSSSYVIKSLGKDDCAQSSLRFSFGRGTKKSDLIKLIKALKDIFENSQI